MQITSDRLKEIVSYEPETGIFRWRARASNRVKVGSPAGTVKNGYRYIRIDGHAYRASRLAWLYVTGEWPTGEIDHADTDRLNDRWANLREATSAQNKHSTGLRRDNTSGVKGVHFEAGRNRWRARIRIGRRNVALGYFQTKEQAAAAYQAAASKFHQEFARLA